jgi:hypothetical protein
VGILAILFLSCAVVSAQVETAKIAGTVTDQSGAVVVGAVVTLKNTGTNVLQTD